MPPEHDAALIERLTCDSGDLDDVRAIASTSFSEAGIDFVEELSRSWSFVWVARLSGTKPLAFLLAWHVADELHVLTLATSPSHRRKGLGLALLKESIAFAASHQVRLVLLEVRRSNEAAIALYRQCQFSTTGVRPRYYADNQEDAIEMTLRIDPITGQVSPREDHFTLEER